MQNTTYYQLKTQDRCSETTDTTSFGLAAYPKTMLEYPNRHNCATRISFFLDTMDHLSWPLLRTHIVGMEPDQIIEAAC